MTESLSTIALGVAVSEGTKILTGKIISNISISHGFIKALFQRNSADFEPYLNSIFERCTKVKTIINRSHPVDLLSMYVSSSFNCGDKEVDDFSLIDQNWDQKRVVISGTGGGGKTIL